MVAEPKKGHTYWLAGHCVYAELHVVPVKVKDVYEDDNAINGIIDVSGVPIEFRSEVQDGEKVNSVIYPEDLFLTRKEAAEALAVYLFMSQSKLDVACTALRNQFFIADGEAEQAEKAKPSIRQRGK